MKTKKLCIKKAPDLRMLFLYVLNMEISLQRCPNLHLL